jgi:hypothetical protein
MKASLTKAPIANNLLYWFARLLFRIAGWRTGSKLPSVPKYVIQVGDIALRQS